MRAIVVHEFGGPEVLKIEEAPPERFGQFGEKNEAIALGQKRHDLGDTRVHVNLGENLGNGGALARDRNGRIEQGLAQTVVSGKQLGQRIDLRVDGGEVRLLLQRNVEQRAGIASGSSSICHGFPKARWSLRQVSQARNMTLYHNFTFDDLTMGRFDDLTIWHWTI